MNNGKRMLWLLSIMMVATLSIGMTSCSKDDKEQTPTRFYNVELSDIESHGSMLNIFQFEEINHRQISSDAEEYFIYYFQDTGTYKRGSRNRVVVLSGKVNNNQTSFTYTFEKSRAVLKYEDGTNEDIVLKKVVNRALKEGDILYINEVKYKRTKSLNEG